MLIAIEDYDAHVAILGPKAGPAILLLHALGADMTIWDLVAQELAQTMQVVRLDFSGHGQSTPSARSLSIDDMALGAFKVLDAIGLPAVHLAGVSIGGMVAQRMATLRPQALHSLTLCCTLPVFPGSVRDMWSKRAVQVRAHGMAPLAEEIAGRWVSGSAGNGPQLDALRTMVRSTDPHSYAAGGAAIAACDLSLGTASIEVPTLVLAGEADAATPANAVAAMANSIPGLREFAVLPDAAHLPMVQYPARVLEAMRRHCGI
jgi:3-oxoadipate enol-lactonase